MVSQRSGRKSMNPKTLIQQKKKVRQDLAARPFEEKVAILIRLQKMAREMAEASGRKFTGAVWLS